jgi:hypothetical protein
LVDESTHSAEITGDEKPLQIVGSILDTAPLSARSSPWHRPACPFEASPISRQRFYQLAIENTFDISLVLAQTRLASASMKWKRTGSNRSAPVRRNEAISIPGSMA